MAVLTVVEEEEVVVAAVGVDLLSLPDSVRTSAS